jgi:hypothetical protein
MTSVWEVSHFGRSPAETLRKAEAFMENHLIDARASAVGTLHLTSDWIHSGIETPTTEKWSIQPRRKALCVTLEGYSDQNADAKDETRNISVNSALFRTETGVCCCSITS